MFNADFTRTWNFEKQTLNNFALIYCYKHKLCVSTIKLDYWSKPSRIVFKRVFKKYCRTECYLAIINIESDWQFYITYCRSYEENKKNPT